MINKLISKTQVRMLEWEGKKSQDYADGYCDAINAVLDIEPIPTLGFDTIKKIEAEIEEAYHEYSHSSGIMFGIDVVRKIIEKYVSQD